MGALQDRMPWVEAAAPGQLVGAGILHGAKSEEGGHLDIPEKTHEEELWLREIQTGLE